MGSVHRQAVHSAQLCWDTMVEGPAAVDTATVAVAAEVAVTTLPAVRGIAGPRAFGFRDVLPGPNTVIEPVLGVAAAGKQCSVGSTAPAVTVLVD